LQKATEKHNKAVEKLEARGRKERRKMEVKEEKQREKEEKKAEEEEEKEQKKKKKDDPKDLKERLIHAETWRRVVEGRITRALEAGNLDDKGTSESSRIAAILEGVDTEVVAEIQKTKISAPSVTSLSSVKS
jgi:hypothetical protein